MAAAGLLAGVAAARLPSAMIGSGLWEVARNAGVRGERLCLVDPSVLTQWEHRRAQCRRTLVSAAGERAEVNYTCRGGDFGTSKVQVLTPRTLRISTQGISRGYPFAYVIHARRLGNCPIH